LRSEFDDAILKILKDNAGQHGMPVAAISKKSLIVFVIFLAVSRIGWNR
jgi:hypothetical protein